MATKNDQLELLVPDGRPERARMLAAILERWQTIETAALAHRKALRALGYSEDQIDWMMRRTGSTPR